jgi:hypothetical protein
MRDYRDELDVLGADLEGLTKLTGWLMTGDLESVQRLAGQYDMKGEVDAVVAKIPAIQAQVRERVGALRDGAGGDVARELAALRGKIGLMDSLLEQLDRYLVILTLRGATQSSGDLLPKLQGWVAVLKGWLAGVERQLSAVSGDR